MRKLSLFCLPAFLGFCPSVNGAVVPIPIEEEFAASQVLYTLASWTVESSNLAADLGFDPLAVFQYDGTFHIFTDPNADPLGDFTGTLSGIYSGADVQDAFDGVMRTTASKEITVNSKLTENGKEKGTDNGKVTVEDDGTATINIKITHLASVEDVTGTGLQYVKDEKNKKMTVRGTVEANSKNSLFQFVYHQDTKEFQANRGLSRSFWVFASPPWLGAARANGWLSQFV